MNQQNNHQANNSYEVIYGIPLFDDLHNYLPALLYDSPNSFANVRDVISYIQTQLRTRFDLFSNNQRRHRQAHSATGTRNQRTPPITREDITTPVSVSVIAANTTDRLAPNGTVLRASAPPTVRTTNQTVPVAPNILRNSNTDDDEDTSLTDSLSQLLTNIMSIPTDRTFTHTYNIPLRELIQMETLNNPDTFMNLLQPVVVRPTREHIAQNTTVGHVSSDNETCAICQESISRTQEIRKINACLHCFHKTCIDTWFETNVHCPICRHDVRTSRPSTTNISSISS